MTNFGPLKLDLIFYKEATVFYTQSIHSFNNDLLSAYCVLGLGPDSGDTAVYKTDEIPVLMEPSVSQWENEF